MVYIIDLGGVGDRRRGSTTGKGARLIIQIGARGRSLQDQQALAGRARSARKGGVISLVEWYDNETQKVATVPYRKKRFIGNRDL